MIGMILCGGYGKRLRPMTLQVPKPLIELREGSDYTILDKQLFEFQVSGIKNVVLLAGYLGDKIEERYGSRYGDMQIGYVIEDQPLGTLNAIISGMDCVKGEDVIVRNGDVVADINLKDMIEHYHTSGMPAMMFITRMRSPYGIVELGESRIRSFREKPMLDYYINGGIYCLSADINLTDFRGGEPAGVGKPLNIENRVFPRLASEGNLGYYMEEGLFWTSVDTTKELEEVRKEYSNRVDKPWGFEKTPVSTEKYLIKELFIKRGYSTSHHMHKEKDETLYIISGTGSVLFDDHVEEFSRNDAIRIYPETPHTIQAIEDTTIHEVSTPHPDDTIRIEDFYPRLKKLKN